MMSRLKKIFTKRLLKDHKCHLNKLCCVGTPDTYSFFKTQLPFQHLQQHQLKLDTSLRKTLELLITAEVYSLGWSHYIVIGINYTKYFVSK